MPDPFYDPESEERLGRAFDQRLAWRLLQVAHPHRGLIGGSLLLFPLIAVAELAQPWLLKVAIDDHILKSDWLGLTWVAGLYIVVLLVLYGLRMLEDYLMQLTGQRVIHDLRAAIFGHLLSLEARFFDRNPVGRLMTRVLSDVEAVSEAFTSGLFAVVADVITLVGVVAVMLWIDWRLTLVTFAIVPPLMLIAVNFRLNARDAYREVRRRLARLNGFLQESLQGMTVIQLFVRERHERERFGRLNSDYRRALYRSMRWEASLYASVEALGSIALALLIWYGGGRIVAESLTFGALVAFIQYTNRFFLPIRDLGAKYTVMQWAMASSERIFGLLDRAPEIVSPAAPAPPRPTGPGRPALEFVGVSFAYEGDAWVLRDCSFRVAPGERVAIVGATGEGKTTCARLLNRSYDVRQGRVLVDGIDVREWELASLRRHVGIIFQDSVLFAGTVEENLRLGADGTVSDAELARAIETARAGFVTQLPQGLGEPLGERGANVSHGQRQLLAIARALVYNPAVLVLDEAMSSVDPESEALIRQAMTGLLAGRTSITIAHRLSTVHAADRILVLHRGRIHEEGTHPELLRRGGLYARLYQLQTGGMPA
ncbi:MAG: antibiotic ABC transporter ATP-binding protein [Candidatus Rokuibacteriota bacterium]|nr:MAG: antibiotic ABC transporter ATP-binding protein [Candidatus Rokubacteria bacterium]